MSDVNLMAEKRAVRVDVNGEHIRDQLRAQGIRLPLHSTASLERSRHAVAQLFLAGMLSVAECHRMDKRYVKLVNRVLKSAGFGSRVK